MSDVRISALRMAALSAFDREARHWLGLVPASDLYWESLPCGGRRLMTGSGRVLSTVRIEATGYLMSVVVERDGGEP